MGIETIITLIGFGFKVVSAICHGPYLKTIAEQLTADRAKPIQCGPTIHYSPNILIVQDGGLTNQKVLNPGAGNPQKILSHLTPVQQILGGPILSSAIIRTPQRLQKGMLNDPIGFLEEVTPVEQIDFKTAAGLAKMVPVMFMHNGVYYLGWQTRRVLSSNGLNYFGSRKYWIAPKPRTLDHLINFDPEATEDDTASSLSEAPPKPKRKLLPETKKKRVIGGKPVSRSYQSKSASSRRRSLSPTVSTRQAAQTSSGTSSGRPAAIGGDIFQEICDYIKANGGDFRRWHVGLTAIDTRSIVARFHCIKKGDLWIDKMAVSAQEAATVLRRLKLKGAGSGVKMRKTLGSGNSRARLVYAYKKEPHTNP